MNLADILESTDVVKPFRMLLYGVAGIGKSTFATHAPAPVFVQTEDGLVGINVPKTKLCVTFQQLLQCLSLIRQAKGQFKTVVLDSLDWMEELAAKEILEKNKAYSDLSKFPYGQGYAALKSKALEVMQLLKSLYYDGFNIILIAHSKPEKVVNPDGTDYDQHSPRLNKHVNPMFKEWVDIIGFCNFSFSVRERQDGMTKTVKVIADKDGASNACVRTITLTGSPAIVAKCRYTNMPDVLPLNGQAFFSRLLGDQTNDK